MHGESRRMRHMRRRMIDASLWSEGGDFPERVFRMHGGLKFYIIWLLSGKNMNGTEIMEEIESQTSGMWKPSPGSVYPILKDLDSERLVIKFEDGRYKITEKGLERAKWIGLDDFSGQRRRHERFEESIRQIENLENYLEENAADLAEFRERICQLYRKMGDLAERIGA